MIVFPITSEISITAKDAPNKYCITVLGTVVSEHSNYQVALDRAHCYDKVIQLIKNSKNERN